MKTKILLKHKLENVLCKPSASSRAPIQTSIIAFTTHTVITASQALPFLKFQIVIRNAKRGKKIQWEEESHLNPN